jgi:hypothetical protein
VGGFQPPLSVALAVAVDALLEQRYSKLLEVREGRLRRNRALPDACGLRVTCRRGQKSIPVELNHAR